jgi:hypothetical protein
MFDNLAKAGVSVPDKDSLVTMDEFFKVAEEFGTLKKIEFKNDTHASDLPSSGIPQRTFFGANVYSKNSSIPLSHVVEGYWADGDSVAGKSKPVFFFRDYQRNNEGDNVTSWVMEDERLILDVFWFKYPQND